jgi:hypothetical protein
MVDKCKIKSGILRQFVSGDIGIIMTGRTQYEKAVTSLIDMFVENSFEPVEIYNGINTAEEYIYETLREGWEILVYEPYNNGFNAFRNDSATRYRQKHMVYTIEEFLEMYDADDTTIEENEVMNMFEGDD